MNFYRTTDFQVRRNTRQTRTSVVLQVNLYLTLALDYVGECRARPDESQ